MSIYAIHKIAHQVGKDPEFRARMQRDPALAIADYPLTDQERRALLAGDVGRLVQLGAHGYLLGNLARHQVVGLTMDNYVQRIHDPGSTA
jgi:Aromatic-ring-opening dioxygenase LigAB, LigA subunit